MTQNTDSRLKSDDIVGQRDNRRLGVRRDEEHREERREADRAVTENREVSEDDRLEMFRQQLFNDALPDLPDTSGYHTCWLTTTNPRDPIHRRMQLGYEPLRPDEVPGMEYASIKTGEYAGMVGVNEMLAFKLPMSLYLKFMQEAHHDAPMREESKLADTADLIREQAERSGTTLYEGDGMTEMRENTSRRGKFS
jgi:hypothetical protein